MFLCDICLQEEGVPFTVSFVFPDSHGPCEVCGEVGHTTDIPTDILKEFQDGHFDSD